LEEDAATLPSTLSASQAPSPGPVAVDPRYDIGPVIGRGGMGEIRIARDTRIDREVAIKLMRGSAPDDESVSRFFREARVQGALEHPAMVPVHDLGLDAGGNPYFVMKKLAGTTLASVLDAPADDHQAPRAGAGHPLRERFPRRTLLARLVDVAQAIVFAHSRGVIHRDIKPANIMLGDFGEAYVLDWGLARIVSDRDSFRAVLPLSGDDTTHTAVGAMLGTPGYMSPEQARGEAIDGATDVFALGTILYEILAGQAALPRGLSAIDATLNAREHRPSARRADGSIPPELDDLCATATAQDRRKRPSARAFVQALEAYLDGDRDEQRRRTLAEEHAARAEADFLMPDGRVSAMREAAAAIAMDPTNTRAGALLGRLLLESPDTPPPEAIAAADRERVQTRRKLSWAGGVGFVACGFTSPVIMLLDIRHLWPLVALMLALFAQGTAMLGLSRRDTALGSRWFLLLVFLNVVIVALFGVVFGPLLIAPIILTGSVAGWLLVPTTYPAMLVVAMHLFSILPLVVLELVHVIPSTFHVAGGGLVLTPWAVELTPVTTAVVMTLAIVGQQLYLALIVLQGRYAAEAAQNKIHTHHWHLEQVFKKSRD